MMENINTENRDFKTIVKEFQNYIRTNSLPLKAFKYSKLQKRFAWFWDNEKIIGDTLAHYELELRRNKISVDIHFEDDDDFKKFQDELEKITLPSNIKWLDRKHKDGRKELTYFQMYDLDEKDLIPKLAVAMEYLETNIGNKIREIRNIKNIDSTIDSMKNFQPLNQILYGPPGTGKTYHTINKAVSIIENRSEDDINSEERDFLKARFDDYVKNGQIAFTTFHQSMSYEDFIEGIKPKTKNEKVTYSVEDGIFKSLVKKALIEYIRKDVDVDSLDDFDVLYKEFVKSIKSYEGQRESAFKTKTGVDVMLVDANENSILIKYLWSNKKKDVEGQHTFSVTKEKLKKVLLEGIVPEKVKSLKAELHPLIGHIHCELFAVYKKFYEFVIASKGEIDSIHFDYEELSFDEIKEQFDLLRKEEITAKKVKPFIIIIDEINRGNVSQIFGELITLIEEDKRLGKEEALEVMLPYSQDKFGIPANVFIIGTMNTADRSVEALDTALRRRFSFEEILSNVNLIATTGNAKASLGIVETIDLPKVLETINHRIEILSNRDHKIGHAYFLKVTTLEELRETFMKNIIPLLQEYFYNDYEKIGWVIGEGFFEEKRIDKKVIFSKFFKAQKPEFDVAYQLADIANVDIKEAMLKLLGITKEDKQPEEIED